jgi:hypothetical protein
MVYACVIHAIDREFAFRPDHDQRAKDPKARLIKKGCNANTLDPGSGQAPVSSVYNTIGWAFARALELHPVRLHWLEVNINHVHFGFSMDSGNRDNASAFLRLALSLLARGLNRSRGRTGRLFNSRVRAVPCLDHAAAERQLVYALTNAVKDGLVERVSDGRSPLFGTYGWQAGGEKLRFWRLKPGVRDVKPGIRDTRAARSERVEWAELELAPLPHMQGWSQVERGRWVQGEVEAVERQVRQERRSRGLGAPRSERLFALDPGDKPKKPLERSRQPLCHASDPKLRREWERSWREIVAAHREASVAYLAGDYWREFPDGTFRPPLVEVCLSGAL